MDEIEVKPLEATVAALSEFVTLIAASAIMADPAARARFEEHAAQLDGTGADAAEWTGATIADTKLELARLMSRTLYLVQDTRASRQ